jgi:hypothetical protein
MLKTVVYTSKASRFMAAYQVDQLVEASRLRNRASGLTGLLVWSERGFAQCLEGPAEAVDVCTQVIFADPRHCEVSVLLQATASAREFPQWTMGYVSIYDGAERLETLRPHFGAEPWGPARTALLKAATLI